ncbi:MAG: galactose-1-epimerase, partial [Chitinophagaceae bacterium]
MSVIKSYTISNNWMDITICTLGCTITSINVPGKNSVRRNIVLCYEDPRGYLDDSFYVGCTVGRVAGRISGSRFTIDGQSFRLSPNDGNTGNHLHGGMIGFNKKIFEVVSSEVSSLTMYYQSADGEEGYPGEVKLWVTVSLSDE